MAYKDRHGVAIDVTEWTRLRKDTAYCVVVQDEVNNVLVRTVWEGIEDVVGAVFATGVSSDAGRSWRTLRDGALTEDEALEQHRAAVELVRKSEVTSGKAV
ncbi:hypothetical protein ACIQU6_33985 [Streptomyces sp. NPDC090442]|uniref:hypothetical protein n=1 Tax=Streptomyces sp. NPDC090442 TaxID=3365962 RepID=UPI0037FD7AAB